MQVEPALHFSGTENNAELNGTLVLEICGKQDIVPGMDRQSGSPEIQVETTEHT